MKTRLLTIIAYDNDNEIILSVIPTVLGKGIPLFQNIKREVSLELIKTTEYGGFVELTYKVLN